MTILDRIRAANRAERIGNNNRRKGQTTSQLPVIAGVRNGMARTEPTLIERLKDAAQQEQRNKGRIAGGRNRRARSAEVQDPLRDRPWTPKQAKERGEDQHETPNS